MENKKIKVNFGNIIEELKTKNINIILRRDIYGVCIGIFIEDSNKNMYQMETYWLGSYLDKLIKNKTVVEFEQIDANIIEESEKDILDIEYIKEFC